MSKIIGIHTFEANESCHVIFCLLSLFQLDNFLCLRKTQQKKCECVYECMFIIVVSELCQLRNDTLSTLKCFAAAVADSVIVKCCKIIANLFLINAMQFFDDDTEKIFVRTNTHWHTDLHYDSYESRDKECIYIGRVCNVYSTHFLPYTYNRLYLT